MQIILIIAFLVYPVNPDNKGLFHSVSPYFYKEKTLYLFSDVFGTYGPRPDILRDRHWYGDGLYGVGYTILPQLELFLANHGYVKYIERVILGDTRFVDMPQILLGVKTGFPLKVGKYSLANGFIIWVNQWVSRLAAKEIPSDIVDEFKPTKLYDLETGIRWLLGFESSIGTSYFNIGYTQVSHFHNGYQKGLIALGGGTEFNFLPYLHPGIEFSKDDIITSVTPQIKFLFKDILNLNFGLDFPISDFDWVPDDTLVKTPRLMLSMNLNFNLKRPAIPSANILVKGSVCDLLSKKPIPGTITFIGPVSGTIKSKGGVYELVLKKAGAYRIKADCPSYKWEEKVIRVMDCDLVNLDFQLLRAVDWSITGRILDKKTEKPVYATIKLVGDEDASTYSDSLSGEYRLWVQAGSYYLHIKAPGYISKKIPIFISNATILQQDVRLEPKK
ncbi:MAG: hypothetical protein QMD71_00345 [bacterium]|nr:hypothetical protein [bacterium]